MIHKDEKKRKSFYFDKKKRRKIPQVGWPTDRLKEFVKKNFFH